MQCSRCQGLMVVNRMQESSSSDAVVGWRCLLCGESVDPGIEANRGSPLPSARARARVPGSPANRPKKGSG